MLPVTRTRFAARDRRPVASAVVLVAVLLILPSSLSACRDDPDDTVRIRIATGSPTAVYHAFGTSLAAILNRELPNVRAEVLVTAASVENVRLLKAGEVELGFTQADVLPAYPGPDPPVVAVARVYDDLLHLVTTAASPIRKLTDLAGRRVSIGAAGSGTEITVNRLLTVAGLDDAGLHRVQLGLDDSVSALRRGEIDAFFFSGGLPVRAVVQFVEDTPARLVDLGEWTVPLRRGNREVYVPRDIPRSVYGMDPVTAVANPNYLLVRADLPEDLVRQVTRLLMERRAELAEAHPAAGRISARSAIATPPLPLHPGAAEYYRDSKP
ncbi:TAXI family TRAP transporter solute-binding subunit [Micromonospora gifhornensis]|uniref:C4-dicarboxylate ABC transporter substrate-binding protein n=1 Tax=Micromonospora gifhornensis TaxID=84594 RepID=A0ABQ4IEF3_9ACTN|nr:C4-dicarboxylate ABC transporter substrate-binding protein [Verrucosispora sp. ts21]GIJ16300.1 C4-dicarboxylate ABC transporter substrate-binding protein [Micromonospora gifhornensis]